MLIAFLDEFGHVGPYVSRGDPRFNHSPVFGLAGFVMPHEEVRGFATWFLQAKSRLLSAEIAASKAHSATWEKKGSELINTRNIERYSEIRQIVFRMINRIYRSQGRLFYYGREKYQAPADSNPGGLYTTVLSHTIRQIDRYAGVTDKRFIMIIDEHSDRIRLLETAAKTMFGNNPARHLIEPPFMVESHLYQTIQAADWIASLVGRLLAFQVRPDEFGAWEWSDRYFGDRVRSTLTHSTLWRPRPSPAA